MGLFNNNITILPTTGYESSFSWQVGFNDTDAMSSIAGYRATVRPLNGLESVSRVPSDYIYYEQTGILVYSNDNQGQWAFPLSTNAAISGGPYRDYQVVIEAHDSQGNTSAGNIVGGTANEEGWVQFNQGYDILAVSNPRQTGIELGNNIPTQNSINTGIVGTGGTGFYLNSGNGYYSLNYMGTHGEINIRYLNGTFDSNLVGGYIYVWTGQFPKLEAQLESGIYSQVVQSQFDFDPNQGIIYNPTAGMAFRGATNLYVSVSFYDNIDQLAIENGYDISPNLYLSDNAICYNDISAGSISMGFQTIYSMQYTGNFPATEILGTGITILSNQQISGNTYVIYISNPSMGTSNNSSYTGVASTSFGGKGGNSVLINYLPPGMSLNGLIPTMTSDTTPAGTCSASSTAGYSEAYYPFNGVLYNLENYWQPAGSLPQWLQYQFASPNVVHAYSLTILGPYNLNSWTFEASNDGSTFTTLDTQSNFNWSPYITSYYADGLYFYNNTFRIPNTNAYDYYRLNITYAQGGGGPNIYTLQVYG